MIHSSGKGYGMMPVTFAEEYPAGITDGHSARNEEHPTGITDGHSARNEEHPAGITNGHSARNEEVFLNGEDI